MRKLPPKISGSSYGFSSVIPNSLLRGASFKTLVHFLSYRDVENPPALQLEVSARMPHVTFHRCKDGHITRAIPTVALTARTAKTH
jgi:hypothetical protein